MGEINPAARQRLDCIDVVALKTAARRAETTENSVWTGKKGVRVKPAVRFSSRWQDKLLIHIDFEDFTRNRTAIAAGSGCMRGEPEGACAAVPSAAPPRA
jgi:hypothetical protein